MAKGLWEPVMVCEVHVREWEGENRRVAMERIRRRAGSWRAAILAKARWEIELLSYVGESYIEGEDRVFGIWGAILCRKIYVRKILHARFAQRFFSNSVKLSACSF